MQENAEYCTGQTFQIVAVLETLGKRLWQCKHCAYEFTQPLTETDPPIIPPYHPKPIPLWITINDEQRARLKAMLENGEI